VVDARAQPIQKDIVNNVYKDAESPHPARRKYLGPIAVFNVAYITYNLLGLVDAPWMNKGAYDKTLCWYLFLSGLVGLSCGAWLGKKVFRPRRQAIPKYARTSKQLSAVFLAIFCGCVGYAIAVNRGLPLLQGEMRFGNSALISNLAPFYGFWVLIRMISDIEQGKRPGRIPPLIYVIGVSVLGYRSPVLAFVMSFTFYLILFRFSYRQAGWRGVAIGALLLVFAASIALFRVSQSYDALRFFANVNIAFVVDHPYVLPLIPALSMFDFSQSTIATLGSVLHRPMYGDLLISNFETLLPGKHWGARNIIGDLTGARWIAGRPMSITPTLQGALFVDFGAAGVFIGFFLIAMMIRAGHAIASSGGALARFCFCTLFSMSIMSIHAGYWDVNLVFIGLFTLIIKLFDKLKAFSHARNF
jgi:oligosaccharide repeat unit polymerase